MTRITFLIMSGFWLLFSCNPPDFSEVKTSNLNPDLALPLAFGEFGIEDILKDDSTSYYKYDNDGLIWLTYHDELLSLSVDELIPNNKINYSFSRYLTPSESAQLATVNSLTINYSEEIEFDNINSNGIEMQLDSLLIKSGVFEFDFNNTLNHAVSVEVTIPLLSKNGIPYSQTLSIGASGTNTETIDLSGYKMRIDRSGGKNRIAANFKITITRGSSVNYAGGLEIDLEIKDNYGFSVAYGDVGSQDILALNSTNLDISLFDFDEVGKTIFVEDAEIKLIWSNSFGIPLRADLNQIEGRNKSGTSFFLDKDNIDPQDLIIDASNGLGQTATGSILINNSNTTTGGGELSLKDFINENINRIKIDAEAITNPAGVTLPSYKNFVQDSSKFKLEIEAAIPMHGRVQGYAFRDTFDIDFGEDADNVKEASIKLYTENGFPVDVATRLVFVDDNYNTLFVLDNSPELILKAAPINAQGKATGKRAHSVLFPLTEQNITDLNKVKKVVIRASLNTSNGGTVPIKFYKDDKLVVKLGARVVADIDL